VIALRPSFSPLSVVVQSPLKSDATVVITTSFKRTSTRVVGVAVPEIIGEVSLVMSSLLKNP